MSEDQAEYLLDVDDWSPAEQRRLDLYAKRMKAVELFQDPTLNNAQISRQLGVTRATACAWRRIWQAQGKEGFLVRKPSGRRQGESRTPGHTPIHLTRDAKAWEGTPTVEGWYAAWRAGECWTFVRVELMEYWIPPPAPKLAAWHRGVPFEPTHWTHWIGPFKMPNPPEKL